MTRVSWRLTREFLKYLVQRKPVNTNFSWIYGLRLTCARSRACRDKKKRETPQAVHVSGMALIVRCGGEKAYLPVSKLEDLERNAVEFLVDGTDDGLDGAFYSLHAGLQRPWILLCKVVDAPEEHDCVHGRELDEFQIFQTLNLPILSLHQIIIEINNSSPRSQTNKPTKKENSEIGSFWQINW